MKNIIDWDSEESVFLDLKDDTREPMYIQSNNMYDTYIMRTYELEVKSRTNSIRNKSIWNR